MKKYTLINHTADIGIHLKVNNKAQLFKNAAQAMFELMAHPITSLIKRSFKIITIQISAENIEELLLSWLRELLFLSETKKIVLTRFKILTLTDNSLKAQAVIIPKRNVEMRMEIKAVTYHLFQIKKKRNHLEAQIIFDV